MKNKVLNILSFIFGLVFINGGLNKFFNYMPIPEDIPESAMKMFSAMAEITWLMPLLALFEIIGGVLFIIPRFRALGALVIFPIMIGILVHHFTLAEGLIIPILLFAILLWAIWEDRQKYYPLIEL